MTKKELVRLIREVVKREIKSAVQTELNEALTVLENKKPQVNKPTQPRKKKSYTNNSMLNEVLNQTANDGWDEIPQQDIRNRFATMQGGAAPTVDINNRPVDKSILEKDGLGKALTRDYSALIKSPAFNKRIKK